MSTPSPAPDFRSQPDQPANTPGPTAPETRQTSMRAQAGTRTALQTCWPSGTSLYPSPAPAKYSSASTPRASTEEPGT